MSGEVTFNVAEVISLEADLGKASGQAATRLGPVVQESGETLRALWVANATATAGAHGVHYPSSITAEPKLGLGSIGVTVGPESGLPQGGMSFEYGSTNQPPHLDGNKAADVIYPVFLSAIIDAASKALDL